MKPTYTHDCERCVFLGHFTENGTLYDLYYCPQGSRPTVIARWSDYGPDYTSGMCFVGQIPSLTEAHRLAKERGLCA